MIRPQIISDTQKIIEDQDREVLKRFVLIIINNDSDFTQKTATNSLVSTLMMMMTSQLLVQVAVPYIGNPSNNFWASSTSNFRKCQGPGAILEIYANCIKKIIIIIWHFEKKWSCDTQQMAYLPYHFGMKCNYLPK